MRLTQFLKQYDTEQKCINFFREQRENQGLKCNQCNSSQLHWSHSKILWHCNHCGYRTGLRKGTVMENSKLPYRIWLTTLYLMLMTKKGYSAKEMQTILNHNRYEPIWLMMHKIRILMGKRDEKYQLDGFVELDEGFFAGHRKKGVKEDGKPVKEIDRNEKVLVAINKNDKGAKYLKMTVVDSLSKTDVTYEIPKMINKSATVITDGRRCYTPLTQLVEEHQIQIIKNKKEVCKTFPWVHIAISNAKKKLKGIHHHVKNQYIQNYLNEYSYRFNRRNFNENIFDRLIIAVLACAWFG
jgi:hypothetical protein